MTSLKSSVLVKDCKGHSGSHKILVAAGKNEWRYYSLTTKQLGYWRGLTKAERGLLVRMQDSQCLICALVKIIERRKRLSDSLYSSMMMSLLSNGGVP